jgi:hypothetical protein
VAGVAVVTVVAPVPVAAVDVDAFVVACDELLPQLAIPRAPAMPTDAMTAFHGRVLGTDGLLVGGRARMRTP